jgi:hypothetical protein
MIRIRMHLKSWIRIRIHLKSWIRIRIKSMQIRKTASQHLFLQLPSDIQGPGSNPGVGSVIRTNIARLCSKYCTLNEKSPQKIFIKKLIFSAECCLQGGALPAGAFLNRTSLTIYSVTRLHTGKYHCQADNGAGK